VHGSVLVQDDVAWFCAGRSSYLDGGLVVFRLDPTSGKILSSTKIDSLSPSGEQKPITPTVYARLDMEGAKNDVLSSDSRHVFMRHWAFDLDGQSMKQEIDHLFSPTGLLDDSWFRRTYWIYGCVYVSGAQGWARTGNERPTGRILAIDEERIYGFGRDMYPPSPGNAHQIYLAGEKEVFFAAAKTTEAAATPSPPASEGNRSGKRKRRLARKSYLWSVPGDIRVRGMLLAGRGQEKRLYVVGTKGDWVISRSAYEGKRGSVLRVLDIEDGKTITEQSLPGLPVFDGLSAARKRLYLSLTDGRVLCLSGD
jgi:hypothetical protein